MIEPHVSVPEGPDFSVGRAFAWLATSSADIQVQWLPHFDPESLRLNAPGNNASIIVAPNHHGTPFKPRLRDKLK